MQRLAFFIGGLGVLTASFFGTLYLLDSLPLSFSLSLPIQSLDATRMAHAKSIKSVLEKYRADRGRFPFPYRDNSLVDLRADLVGGGYIAELPVDPYWKNGRINTYRYRSFDGNGYGLLFFLELGPCQTGIGPEAALPWDFKAVTSCAF